MSNKILIICPTFNEAQNIEEFIKLTLENNLSLLIVDDNSPDGTANLVKKSTAFNQNVFLIERPSKDGLGSAYRTGFKWFLDSHFDYCVEMDADFSHRFTDLENIINKISESDIVIGSRYIENGGSKGWDFKRKTLSKYANILAKYILKSKVNDLTSGFRSFSKNALNKIDFASTDTNGYGFQIEMVYLAEKNNLTINEVPIIFEERRLGKSKMNMKITLEALVLLIKIKFKKI
jgi:dolichol-phosphate mannosyltransferase|tara:strand:+ start:727 stop:1428 length:702 start_codon:yes stop_codon:yes gene_type:complete